MCNPVAIPSDDLNAGVCDQDRSAHSGEVCPVVNLSSKDWLETFAQSLLNKCTPSRKPRWRPGSGWNSAWRDFR